MDPNANIEEQRRLAARLMHLHEQRAVLLNTGRADAVKQITREINEKSQRLAELVIALDGWLCSGGSYPHTWWRR